MPLKEKINSNPILKKVVYWMIARTGKGRPRTWVNLFVNPFFHKRGKGSFVARRTRMDVFPFYKFELGDNSNIEDFCCVNNGVGDVIIGNESHIGIGNMLTGPLTIGNNVIFAQNISMSGLNHGYEDVNIPIHKQKVTFAVITVEDECWIGSNAVLTAGITVGKHSIVGAGSVVTKNVPPFSVVVGNPARVIKKYDFEKKEWVKA